MTLLRAPSRTLPEDASASVGTRERALQDIFFGALDVKDPVERAGYLKVACGEDLSIRAEVEKLLLVEKSKDFLAFPAVDPQFTTEQEGDRIGRYRLFQRIGEGGFGTVWMAEQVEPMRRRVALKIIKLGMDTREVIARFEQERQALALMDHANIAKVFDAGATEGGRPYFVMELVKGIPITTFCDERKLGARERLALFGDVCSAINHAHQKGVIHRDIKPSNVMVTLNGERAVVKVIDFGIAKATKGPLTDKTLFTRFEQFLGTPAYMSPEQATISELDIDTRSDIYSLGVLLYELLTGQPPFDVKSLVSAGFEEMRRVIREVEPPRPSARLSTAAGEERTALARARCVEPGKLGRLVAPDLDWIVMKALDKDRARRYETANGLALDIVRFLSGEPVSARPPTAAYRFGKYARRHKMALLIALAFVAGLVMATIVSILMAIRADARAAEAEHLVGKLASTRVMALDDAKEAVGAQTSLAALYQALGRRDEAVELQEDAVRAMRTILPADHKGLEGAMRQLVEFYDTGGRREDAEKLRAELDAAPKKF